ncbi:MAG: right-handed parallel beta-helix repeat-containing protein, partial [Anaerolineales bacterium]|nr:right-handed parallel beta-helix repeat-containing protein [Anaerolineales bacterium]
NSDADTDDGSCDLLGQGTGNQDCTLREAINAANANADGSMITFAANYTITLTSALPDITTILTIDGEGAANTIVQASACDPVTLPGGCTPAGWRVFTITSGTATLKDMTVRNGRSSGNGGGILVSPGSTVTIINSTLSSNAAANYGGGIENNGGLLTIYNSTLAGNAADTGGGIDNNTGTVTMDNNTLSANSATSDGGGIYNYGGPLTMTMGILDGNSATNGGGIYNTDSAILTINNSTFSGNPATSGGGGLYNNSSESVTISNSTFSDNSAANDGGGINSNNAGPLTINNSTLAGNWTMNRGGGIYNNSSNALTLNNSTFSGNWTTNYGGGIENDGGTVALINSTFSGNSAGTGGGLDNFGGTATLNNNTFSGNSATEGGGIYNDSGTVTIGNSIIANSTSGNDCGGPITSGGHNLDSDNTCSLNATGDIPGTNPLLDPLADNGGDTETHALQAGSAAIDAGDNATCTATDQRGLSRPAGLACDIGAYEYIPCFVERTGDNVTDFMSADASAVQDAINTASPDDTIKIAGTCAGVQQTGSFTQTVYINKNLTLQGGYDPDNWLASPDPNTYPTVLDAEDNGRVVYLANASQLTLAGLTLQNGHISSGNGGGLYVAASGMVTISQSHLYSNTATAAGGIYISPNSEVSLSDSTVNANESLATNADGGGIGNNNGTLNLMNVAMFDNEAGRQGGALSNNGQTTIINSDIYSNTAGTFGGAIVGNNQLTIENSRIANNWAENQGGAMHFSGVVTITHSLITGNSAADAGGISHFGGQMTIINTTISQNIARNAGTSIGGVRAWGGALTTTLTHTSIVSNTRSGVGRAAGTMTLTNSIIAYNGSSECSGTGITSGGYNLAEDSSCSFLTATGDITNTNPLLGPLADNGGPTLTHLPASGSEAIDAIPSGNCPFVTDQREVFRPQGTACDIGALEVVVVPGPPVLEIIQLSATDGQLIWLNPGIGCRTDVYEDTSPYFTAVSALENDATAPFPLVGKFGAVSPNYFYLLQMTCDGTLMESNRVGEFDFAIVPGN